MAVDQAALAELFSFLETFPEPHILCDRDYRILAANAAYRANWVDKVEVVGTQVLRGVASIHRALRPGGRIVSATAQPPTASSLSDLTPAKSANFTMRNKKAGFP
jgi:SAM-dependent methyltransferase